MLAATRLQISHISVSTTYSTTNVCWRMVPACTSFWTVSFTFSRREWGSVQMKPASTSFTLLSPRRRFRQ